MHLECNAMIQIQHFTVSNVFDQPQKKGFTSPLKGHDTVRAEKSRLTD